ncbi:MATE family efflux transporter DinF [Chimaeribacter californicus]|uniref:MATE family efflux transporter DinF n=1 Tax=Chimaeribacter californicus TaxID=2060067 RepID=A0A2N5DVJ5_9GAMM|nr:MATE family efflux transporter DinF [Chimaeribacter californicus]PLR31118.1 MATE family efflux transporter DinF [Chimaeribacter californicus]
MRRTVAACFGQTDRDLWRLALPMIFSNITVPLLGLVDTAVIGHLDSPDYLGGVAVGAMATSFLFMLLLFLRMSTTGMAAQAFGAQSPARLARAFIQPLLLALLAGLAILLLRHPLIDLLLNIVLDLWLVMGLHWNVRGAAWATVTAEYATLLLGLWLVWRVMQRRGIGWPLLKQGWHGDLRRLLTLNRDIMLRSLLLQLCFASLTIIGARLGSEIVAVNALLMNLLTFTAYALDGFAYAVEAHSGEAFGARNRERLLAVWYAACRQAGMVALGFAAIYALFGMQIVHALTSLPALRQLAQHYLGWQVVLPLAGVWCYLLDGMFVGATRGREMRNSMAVAAAGYGLTLLALPWLGNHALWLALTVFLALRGAALGWVWHRHQQRDSWFTAAPAPH